MEKLVKEDYEVIGKIMKRVYEEGLSYGDGITMMMDLEFATKDTNMDLDKLLGFDSFNFAHDIIGIRNHIDRTSKKIVNCFSPRCSR